MEPAPDLLDVIARARAAGRALGLEFAAQTGNQIAVSVEAGLAVRTLYVFAV
jgi:hypothetical protein